MRVTAGKIGGRRIRVPAGAVRPTQDRVREALFSILGDKISGCRFLDLFAGSGAVGLEAWSRGADHVSWVEADSGVFRQMKQNIKELIKNERSSMFRMDAIMFLNRGLEMNFDIVFADPPYEWLCAKPASQGCTAIILRALAAGAVLAEGGIVIIEQAKDASKVDAARFGWVQIDDRTYGDTRLDIFKQAVGQAA
ncbi:MAG: 16S rRNA (guanine(966)-N(2))-methyltransferase RsmD [Lentisphaerae bacterium]|nr:16S rRNA (guanine(966)-N(2))-methyltransferase RsmD [Lentisphaerota bacterium]